MSNRRYVASALLMLLTIHFSLFGLDKEVTFDNHSAGAYTEAMASGDFSSNSWNNGLDEGRGRIIGGSEAFSGKSLRITYAGGEYGPADGGVQFSYRFSRADEMNLEYKLKFEDGFEFVKGGKLPGLCGGNCPSGGESADNGWSARFMWRVRNIDGQDRVLGEVYLYHPDKPGQYGEDLYFKNRQFEFQAGRWYTLRQYVKMNSPGSYDGELTVWVDGELVLTKTSLRFRHSSDVGVDHMNFSTFFGGGDNSWAPSSDQHVYFDDFHIFSGEGSSGNSGGSDAGALLDDFEDDIRHNNLGGVWYSFNDANSGGLSTVTLEHAASARSGGGQAARASYSLDKGDYEYDPYIGVGTYLSADKNAIDISAASGIRFWYKGGSSTMVFRVETADIAATERMAYYRVSTPPASDWTEFSATWDEFMQPSWSGVTPMDLDLTQTLKLSLQVKGDRNASSPETGELLIDDIELIGMPQLPTGAATPAFRSAPKPSMIAFRDGAIIVNSAAGASELRVYAMTGKMIGRWPVNRAAVIPVADSNLSAGAHIASLGAASGESVSSLRFVIE